MKRLSLLAQPILLSALALSAAALPAAAAEVHPFYEQRLAAGILALSQGSAAAAEAELQLAAFGMLDEPARLIVALAHLALAEQASGDAAERDEALQRLLTVEQRFTVWAQADLPPGVRQAVESLLGEHVPEAGLFAVPAFRPIARSRAADRIAALPAAERRRELAALTAAQPDVALWQVMLGELELAAGDAATAISRAQRALASGPSAGEEVAARCLRGTALARSGSCAAAIADLEACPATRRELEPARLLLECHSELSQWQRAKELADALPPAIASRRDVRRLVGRIEREAARRVAGAAAEAAEAAESTTAAPTGAAPAEAPPDGAPPAAELPAPTATTGGEAGGPTTETAPAPAAPSAADPGTALPAADRQRLDEARRLMAQAERAGELERPLALAVAVADAHPLSVEAQHLAAEIAYRASRWPLAVTYFRRGGEPVWNPQKMFYFAVALWESGESGEAARVLEAALPRLPESPFVDEYVARVLGRLR